MKKFGSAPLFAHGWNAWAQRGVTWNPMNRVNRSPDEVKRGWDFG